MAPPRLANVFMQPVTVPADSRPISRQTDHAALMHKSAMPAALLIAAAAGIADLCISAAWSVCLDIGRESAGTVTGCMNTFANLGGAIAPVAMGYAVQSWGSWSTPLLITSALYVFGGLISLLVDPNIPLVKNDG